MKRSRSAPSVTSLPQAPQDEAGHRVRRYALTMGIRMVCFLAMALIRPYGWYTWVLAIAAAVLPYIAVVFANAGSDSIETQAESPQQELTSGRSTAPPPTSPNVWTVQELRVDQR